MIDTTERKRLQSLVDADKPAAIQGEIDRIHRCVNTGTTDRDAVNDALDRLVAITQPDKTKPAVKPVPAFGLKPVSFGAIPTPKPSQPLSAH